MKKVILLMMAMFAFGLQNVSAQDAPMKIVTGDPDLKVKVTGCSANGESVFIDLILINMSEKDVGSSIMGSTFDGDRQYTEAFDDQGNRYFRNSIYKDVISFKVANQNSYIPNVSDFPLPSEVPVKLRIRIEDFSEKAESITKFRLLMYCNALGLNAKNSIVIRNIPISRN